MENSTSVCGSSARGRRSFTDIDPALTYLAALVQAKALQVAGRQSQAYDFLLDTTSREMPGVGNLRARADILLTELPAQMGQP